MATIAALEGVTHHVLRHTGASAMVAAGISLRVVQDIAGWSTLRILERCAHPSGAEMSRAVRVLTAYTATGTKTATATKNDPSAPKKRGRVSAVKSEDVCGVGVPKGIRERVEVRFAGVAA